MGTWNCVLRLGQLTYLIQVHGKRRYAHIDYIRSSNEVDESVISDPVLPYQNIPSVVPNGVPNPIVIPISENIENCESSTVEKGIPIISHVKSPLRRSMRNIKKPKKMDIYIILQCYIINI